MAITEYYVRADAAGGGNGTTDANSGANGAFTWAELKTRMTGGVAAAGDRYNVKSGTYSIGSQDSWTNDGTVTSPIIIRGFKTTPGDLDGRALLSTGKVDTTDFPILSYGTFRFAGTGASFIIYENLAGTTTSNNTFFGTGPNSLIRNCHFTNSSTGASAAAASISTAGWALGSTFIIDGASGGSCALNAQSANPLVLGCYINGGPASGLLVQATGVFLFNTITGHAIYGINASSTSQTVIIGFNTITKPKAGSTSDGINVVIGTTSPQRIFCNLITDQTQYGINGVSAANCLYLAYNKLRNNASGNINSATDSVAATSYNHITGGATGPQADYVDYANDNFALIAGSLALSNGFPKYIDIGALNRQPMGLGSYIIGG